jgi:ABC-type sugar transport system ATPase subunit
MPSIELVELSKRFGDVLAVDRLSLDIAPGEFVSLLGPSGCGKSTTLRMVLGLEQPTTGEIRIDGRVVTTEPPKERQVGIVFQDYAVFPHMSPRGNIEFGLRMQGLPAVEIEREVDAIVDALDVNEVLPKPTRDLSVGELQQVALARTLVTKPAIILLDEPLSNLEAYLRTKVRSQLKRLQRDLHQTAIYVTHDQVEAMALSDRIAIMSGGRLQQYATPEQVYRTPANLFVAGFIGSPPMNVLPGELSDRDGAATFVGEGVSLKLGQSAHAPLAGAASRRVHLGVRPEDIEVRAGDSGGVLHGRVDLVEPLGSETVLRLDLGGVAVRSLSQSNTTLRPGDAVTLDFALDRVCLFDSDTTALLPAAPRAVAA